VVEEGLGPFHHLHQVLLLQLLQLAEALLLHHLGEALLHHLGEALLLQLVETLLLHHLGETLLLHHLVETLLLQLAGNPNYRAYVSFFPDPS
jgi:hypothetical protein